MARPILLSRDEAELIVEVLEHNYETGEFGQVGLQVGLQVGSGADVARELREIWGMAKQPILIYKSK